MEAERANEMVNKLRKGGVNQKGVLRMLVRIRTKNDEPYSFWCGFICRNGGVVSRQTGCWVLAVY